MDAIISFSGLLQFLVGQMLLSLICQQKYVQTRRIGWLVAGVALFLTALLNYEISYLFLPMYLLTSYAWLGEWRRAAKSILPHGITAFALVAFTLGLRFNARLASPDYSPNFQFTAIAKTVLAQAWAAMPCSYSLTGGYSRTQLSASRIFSRWDNWMFFAAAAVITIYCLRKHGSEKRAEDRASTRMLLTMGALIWILPGLPIALSPKYQAWARMGDGYLPVYVQYFGVAMLAVGMTNWLLDSRHARKFAVALISANACIALITFDTHRNVIAIFDQSMEADAMRNLSLALKSGVADEVPEDATLLAKTSHIWWAEGPPRSSAVVSWITRRRINVVITDPRPNQRPVAEQLKDLPPPGYVMVDRRLDHDSGFVIVGRLEQTDPAFGTTRLGVRSLRIFVRGSLARLGSSAEANIMGRAMNNSVDSAANESKPIEWGGLTLLRSGKDWALYEGAFSEATDAATLRVAMR